MTKEHFVQENYKELLKRLLKENKQIAHILSASRMSFKESRRTFLIPDWNKKKIRKWKWNARSKG